MAEAGRKAESLKDQTSKKQTPLPAEAASSGAICLAQRNARAMTRVSLFTNAL
jgi:hypothetical protein